MDVGRINSRRALLILCLASAAWAFSFGVGAPLAAFCLKDAGYDNKLIGINTSLYYLGVAIVAPLVPWCMRAWGTRCMVLGMALDGLTVMLFPWVHSLASWYGLRLLGGAGTALCLIPLETEVNRNAPPERRARDFGIYAFSVALGIGLGPVVGLPLYRHAPRLAFFLGGAITLVGIFLLLPRWKLGAPPEVEAAKTPSTLVPAETCFSLGTAWAQGFIEGGMVTFLSVYLISLGYTENGAGGFMGTLFLGVILFQVPVAWLADRLGVARILLSCHFLVLIGLGFLAVTTGPLVLGAWLFLVGACCSALYPLGLALLGVRVPSSSLAKANAWYLTSNCAGSLSGPIAIGIAMDLCGNRAMFVAAAGAILLALMLPILVKWTRSVSQSEKMGAGNRSAA